MIYLHLADFHGFHLGKYAIHDGSYGNEWVLRCMFFFFKFCQQRLDPQLLDAWNGLGEAWRSNQQEKMDDTDSLCS